jgi:hypothetical protein
MSWFGIVVGILGSAAILLHTYSRSIHRPLFRKGREAADNVFVSTKLSMGVRSS